MRSSSLRLAEEAPYAAVTEAQRVAMSSAKFALSKIERTSCGTFMTPASKALARHAAADLEAAARQLRSALR